jgi:hypothetical protein
MIHLQRRPFKWFEFRNVSLHPGYLTAASVRPIGITADRDYDKPTNKIETGQGQSTAAPQDRTLTSSATIGQVDGQLADLRELRKAINDLRLRANSLRYPKSLDVLVNPDFERPRQGDSLPGWTFAEGDGITVDLDSKQDHTFMGNQNGRSGYSLRVRSSGPATAVRSNPFPVPKTGRLSVWMWLRIDNPANQPPLRLGIEGRLNGEVYYRYAEVGANDGSKAPSPPPLPTKWAPYLARVDGVPSSGLTDLRVAVDLMGKGEVWIDDIRVFDLWFDNTERNELIKKFALADQKLGKGEVIECERILRSDWADFLRQHVPLEDR